MKSSNYNKAIQIDLADGIDHQLDETNLDDELFDDNNADSYAAGGLVMGQRKTF